MASGRELIWQGYNSDGWGGYQLRVSVKYVRQATGEWIKFYQSCWYERAR